MFCLLCPFTVSFGMSCLTCFVCLPNVLFLLPKNIHSIFFCQKLECNAILKYCNIFLEDVVDPSVFLARYFASVIATIPRNIV